MPEIVLPPGILKTQSEVAAIGRWVDCDHIRFVNGMPEKIKGYKRYVSTALLGVPRALCSWLNPTGFELLSAGTERKLYVHELDGDLLNITPIRASSTINNNPFATTNGSPTVTVTDTAHGATVGAFVTFSGAASTGGLNMNAEWQIVTVPTANTYTFTHTSNATSTVAAGGGASVVAAYQINPGISSPSFSAGYGAGDYGEETYGTERSTATFELEARFWSLHNYGNKLLATPGPNGGIYLYDSSTDTEAEILANAPTDVRYSFVTEVRFITALREGMVVEWADRDDITDWTPGATDTANERTLPVGSKLIAGAQFGHGINLIWSDTAVYMHQYTGSDFVYDTRVRGTECGLIGPAAFANAGGAAFWMSGNSFHMMNGGIVSAIPNQDDVKQWVFANMSAAHRVKTTCWFNSDYREVWWSWPSTNATEPDRYVMVNIDTFAWAVGTGGPTAAARRIGVNSGRVLFAAASVIYQDEVSDTNANGAALDWFIVSGFFLPAENQMHDVFGFVPDFDWQTGDIEATFTGKDKPNSTSQDVQTVTLEPTTELADLRLEARYFSMRLGQTGVVSGDMRLGKPTINLQPAGMRP